jgi:hypothetical protein
LSLKEVQGLLADLRVIASLYTLNSVPCIWEKQNRPDEADPMRRVVFKRTLGCLKLVNEFY